ncbi:hypothetical protein [Mesorhizobium sp. ANAO-SY3R2]|uniref:hypothetical protein n=1 Tax=Mesorhizobium sp. ANAO-SY3R2 TaxID=3166644 RepID=UPI00366F4D1E
MSETTKLSHVRIVGPRLALTDHGPASTAFTWHADLSVAYLGKDRPKPEDRALVNYTQGLRVLLQAPESDPQATPIEVEVPRNPPDPREKLKEPPIHETVRLRTPHLLVGNVHAGGSTLTFAHASTGYAVRAAAPEAVDDNNKVTRGFSSLVLTPLDPWPTPQKDRKIEVPRFAIGEQRLRVLVGVTKKEPEGFLRLAKLSNDTAAAFVGTLPNTGADLAKLPRVELQLVKVTGATGSFVALELTPDGIELRGTVANPLKSFGVAGAKDRIDVILRLVHKVDPVSPDQTIWSLELVREEDPAASDKIGNAIRQALGIVRAAFAPWQTQPLVLDIDTVVPDLAVRWPLELKDKSLRLPGADGEAWNLRVDAGALRARLRGSPVREGEFATEVAIVPNMLSLSKSAKGVELVLDADRRDAAEKAKSGDKVPGPWVTLRHTGAGPTQVSIAPTDGNLDWFLDRRALAHDLAERYARAGVHPAGADTTYAFVPLTEGWLQLPLSLDDDGDDGYGNGAPTDSIGFEGQVAFAIDDSATPGVPLKPAELPRPLGRRLEITAADRVHATATFKAKKVADLTIDIRGAAGTVDGLLWVAAGSPSPENILPQFDAGPAALMGCTLAFSRLAKPPAQLMPLTSKAFVPDKEFALILPTASNGPTLSYLWRGYTDMPLVTAISMTRTAESSGNPSSTRGLLCREFDRASHACVLTYPPPHGFATLTLEHKKKDVPLDKLPLFGGAAGPQSQVPLVPVTLPGIELKPAAGTFTELETHLRFDLPMLDELFANTRLPEKAPVNTNGAAPELPPPDAPTSLDPDRLMMAWQKAVDRLDLSRVQASKAFDEGAQARKVVIETLFEGATWTTDFALYPTVQIEAKQYAFGSYYLGKERFGGRQALQGLSRAFDVNKQLVDAAAGSKNPLRIIGFAAALWEDTRDGLTGWRDTRAAITAKLPTSERFRDEAPGEGNGLVLREVGIVGADGKLAARSSRATLAKPIPVELPAVKQRTLGLWFRDLPLKTKSAGHLSLVQDADDLELTIGPSQAAFDRTVLPRSIHEWRLCNDAKAGGAEPPSAYEIALGPLRFRPLRLLDVTLDDANGWSASGAKIGGTVSLASSGVSTFDHGPFEPELAYATGNLAAISLVKHKHGLTFAGAGWESVQVDVDPGDAKRRVVTSGGAAKLSFRLANVAVAYGPDVPSGDTTTVLLELTADKAAGPEGLPNFSAAKLTAVLFGRRVKFETDAVAVISDAITATFDASLDAGDLKDASGIRLTRVKIAIVAGRTPTLTLSGELKIAAADPSEGAKPLDVVQHTLGGALYWLNHEIISLGALLKQDPRRRPMMVDHRRGVIDIAGNLQGASAQPIAGLTAAEPKIRFSLTMAILRGEPKGTNSDYVYRSVSGFGEFSLASSDGPLQRFDHVVASKDNKSDPAWTSRIMVDVKLAARESRIHWPIGSLPEKLMRLDTGAYVDFANLAALVSSRALRGVLSAADAGTVLKHVVTMTAIGQPIATSALSVEERDAMPRVAFQIPWTFHALAEHHVSDPEGEDRTLAWTSLDHVNAIDAHVLIEAAKAAVNLKEPYNKGIFAFSPRYKNIHPDEGKHPPVVKAGLVLRAFAQAGFPVEALAVALAELDDPTEDGIIFTAAGPTTVETTPKLEGPFWPAMPAKSEYISCDRHGLVLALPWLTAIDEDYQLGEVLDSFKQAPRAGTAEWDAPDVDWAAGSSAPLARKPSPIQPVGSGSAADIASLLARALQRGVDAEPVRALAAVEQVFLRPGKNAGPLEERPIWLRSLLALRTLWQEIAEVECAPGEVLYIDERAIMIVPSGEADGGVARFKLGRRRLSDESEAEAPLIGAAGRMIAIDRERAVSEPMPATETLGASSGAGGDQVLRRARLASRAECLVKQPVAVVAVAAWPEANDKAADIWIRVEVSPDFDDGALDIPVEIDAQTRLYASPALGWPTAKGTAKAATGAMGMGEDRAFQDAGPKDDPDIATPDDVKRYGSGLSGRAASLSLPARASTDERPDPTNDDLFIDTRSPVFIAFGRKMIFNRPAPADLPIVSPPARHLSPTEARAIVPAAQDLQATLGRVVTGHAAPLVPPHLERTSFGLRPGAMQAEFDALLFTDGLCRSEIAAEKQEDLSAGIGRFGRPGHAGPRLVRQLRPPRAPALPRVPLSRQDFVTSHGRRTFVELDDHATDGGPGKEQDVRFPTPFRLFEGVGTILRRDYKSYRIQLLGMPLLPEWGGTLTLRITSPSYRSGADELAKALAELGLLSNGPKGLGAVLSINRFIVRFREARWSIVGDAVDLTLVTESSDLANVRSRLDAVDGDSQVILQMRCAQELDGAATPPVTFALASAPAEPTQAVAVLEAEPRRQFALRVPVRPTARPSVNVGISTLVFGDPSYDRELSGPGPSNSQRDTSGVLWKVALDRFEYGTDTPFYFAFGSINVESGLFGDTAPNAAVVTLQRQVAVKDDSPSQIQDLKVANMTNGDGIYEIKVAEAYGITFDQLRNKDGSPVEFGDGDQIVVSIRFTDPANVKRDLSVRATVVPRPVVAPPPAVFALVAPFDDGGKQRARVALHATAPLPQRIEFPNLAHDLAIGHIRRRALFVWSISTVPAASPEQVTLVKIDRAGGGQLPERGSDLFLPLPLPQ